MKSIYNTDRLGVRCITDWLLSSHYIFAEKPPAEPDAVSTDAGKSELMLSSCKGRAEMPDYYSYALQSQHTVKKLQIISDAQKSNESYPLASGLLARLF